LAESGRPPGRIEVAAHVGKILPSADFSSESGQPEVVLVGVDGVLSSASVLRRSLVVWRRARVQIFPPAIIAAVADFNFETSQSSS